MTALAVALVGRSAKCRPLSAESRREVAVVAGHTVREARSRGRAQLRRSVGRSEVDDVGRGREAGMQMQGVGQAVATGWASRSSDGLGDSAAGDY
jgi:hypothetical protein